jgi:hypothetical protein
MFTDGRTELFLSARERYQRLIARMYTSLDCGGVCSTVEWLGNDVYQTALSTLATELLVQVENRGRPHCINYYRLYLPIP